MEYLVEHLAPLLVTLAALGFSLYNFAQARGSKQRKLAFTIYCHADRAQERLAEQKKGNAEIRRKIEEDASYTPYIVKVSPANELAYGQVIEVIERLNRKNGELILDYFHSQSDLHAFGQSFNSEFVRGWDSKRKLTMWMLFEKQMEETIKHAASVKKLKKLLGDKKFSG